MSKGDSVALGTEEALPGAKMSKIDQNDQNDEKDVILDLPDGLFSMKEWS